MNKNNTLTTHQKTTSNSNETAKTLKPISWSVDLIDQ